MKKVLFTASTDLHLLTFHLPYLEWFKSNGFEVHVAYNGERAIPLADKTWKISFGRSPFDKQNIKAYSELKTIITENHFDIIHCHTPMASIVTRLAARKARKKGTKVIYTVHGFHFYKGAPLLNWLIFFPIEWIFSSFTDAIITINAEDYEALHKWKFRSKGKYKIHGIGVNPQRINLSKKSNKDEIKKEFEFHHDDFIILYLAEFSARKNHQFIFQNIPLIIKEIAHAKFLFAGENSEITNELIKYSENYQFNNQIHIAGFHNEVNDFLSIADIGISSSISEGLPMGVSEMMYAGIPVVVSDIRGHNDLIENGENGFLFSFKNPNQFTESIVKLYQDKALRLQMGLNANKSIQKFMLENTMKEMIEIYKQYL